MAGTPLKLVGALAKIEGTYATDPTPTVLANGVRLGEIGSFHSQIEFDHAFSGRREDVASGGLMEPAKNPPVGRKAKIRLVWEAKGPGTAYASNNKPEADPLFRSCAWAGTLDTSSGTEKMTYAPVDTSIESCTIWAYSAGLLFKVVGCRGTFSWPIKAGANATVVFEMEGMVTAAVATTALPAITYQSTKPPQGKNIALTLVGGTTWTPDVDDLSFEAGVECSWIDDANGADGLQGYEVVGRTSRFKAHTRTETVAVYDAHGQANSGVLTTIDLTLGTTQYNRMKLDVNTGYPEDEPKNSDYQGTSGWDNTFLCHDGSIIFD